MRRLPGFLLITLATLIVLVALVVSGLRFVLPHIERFRPQIAESLAKISGASVDIGTLQGNWQSFGPTLEIRAFSWQAPQQTLQIERVTLALDIWNSLLHWRWQFRDLTFYNLQLESDEPLRSLFDGHNARAERVVRIFLYQFDHFTLRDSRIRFLSPSGEPLQLDIPQLTWLNTKTRHRAQGEVGIVTPNGQHGYLQVKMDLHDKAKLLGDGQIYVQADEIDLKPWLNRWVDHHMGLTGAEFSLSAWLTITKGEMASGHLLMNKGQVNWTAEGQQQHYLAVDDLAIQMKRMTQGWQFDLPALNLITDGIPWPKGRLSAFYPMETASSFLTESPPKTLLIRAEELQLERITPLVPMLAFLKPELVEDGWQTMQPEGRISQLALDIPLTRPEQSRFMLAWQDARWQAWKLWPGIDHFSGRLSGDLNQAIFSFSMKNSMLNYHAMFREPLAVKQAEGTVHVIHNAQGWNVSSEDLSVKTDALWLKGEMRYQQPWDGEPRLSILSGIRLSDTREAWRYFPEPLMGTALVDYLKGALAGGHVDNATLVYEGNPHHFPYPQHNGHFQVHVPLREATFRFQPAWPSLTQLNIDLDFRNDGLWMQAPAVKLGAATGYDIQAVIPQYQQKKLLVEAMISGKVKAVQDYFQHSPLHSSVGVALTELQLDGEVSGRLHLDIPFNGSLPHAQGEVTLHRNNLLIKPLASALSAVSGTFRFDDEKLSSGPMKAVWFGQPVDFRFRTTNKEKAYQIEVALEGQWLANKLTGLPGVVATEISGVIPWKTQVDVTLPQQGIPAYQAQLNADLMEVSTHLPMPLDKKADGKALPLQMTIQGDLTRFTAHGKLGKQNHFNSEFTIPSSGIKLQRAVWREGGNSPAVLPDQDILLLELPALALDPWLHWLAPFPALLSQASTRSLTYPDKIILQTPELDLVGQQWHKLQLTLFREAKETRVSVQGSEINAQIIWDRNHSLRANVAYLYYNPTEGYHLLSRQPSPGDMKVSPVSFRRWPSMQLRCHDCWIMGQRLNKVEADLVSEKNALLLKHGLMDTGNTRVVLQGSWRQVGSQEQTSLQGSLTGKDISESTHHFGVNTPLKRAPFDINFALHWQGEPWQPQTHSINGKLEAQLSTGEIDNLSRGRAGQLLRLVSFDALLRKLQLDFHDTFGEAFYFDQIRGNATIDKGILATDDLFIDGLEADIAMKGEVDLKSQQIHMQAVIAPAISTTMGVAAAFAVNPVVGAAVFAASKALGPLWNKISLIRYTVEGTLDNPTIQEVISQAKEE